MDKYSIVKLKLEGMSIRKIARELNMDRKTVNRYWTTYQQEIQNMKEFNSSLPEVQERIVLEPTYDSSNRKTRKYTKEMDQTVDVILAAEEEKNKKLGNHKQQLTYHQIHQKLVDKGFKIGITTISNRPRICIFT
ncbi:MAG: helix-turn-helix domain-containing protein [Caldisericia bacterium]|nr:helix-turn-helix domain-containing protein [Caldisericia bacterium]